MGVKTSIPLRDLLSCEEFVNIIYNHEEFANQKPELKEKATIIYNQRRFRNFIVTDSDHQAGTRIFKFSITEGFKNIGNYEMHGEINNDTLNVLVSKIIFKLGTI